MREEPRDLLSRGAVLVPSDQQRPLGARVKSAGGREHPRAVLVTLGDDERDIRACSVAKQRERVVARPRHGNVVVTAVTGVELVGEQRTRRGIAIKSDDPWSRLRLRFVGHRRLRHASRTGNENIIPLWLCSAM